jgi:hypothetical protein
MLYAHHSHDRLRKASQENTILRKLMQTARCASALAALCCVAVCQSVSTRIANDPEKAVLPQPCATDPVYREFERIQADAYVSDKEFNFRLLLDSDSQNKVQRDVIKELNRRSIHSTGVLTPPPGFDAEIQTELTQMKVPTCYEIPGIYFMIDKYAKDVETARRELGLPLADLPRFGSLPSNDINAYTYPSSDGHGEVIAINYQLFNFIYQLAELSVHAVDPAFDSRTHSQAELITQGLLNISYNSQAKDTFVAAIVGLLLGKPIARGPVSPSEEPLVIFFGGAMERFVFAHEYGHLIKGHLSHKMPIPTGATGTHEYEVFSRTWQQELEADSVGLQLLSHILLRSAEENPSAAQGYIYALKAPLFFFDSLELLDRARFMDANGAMPPQLTNDDKSRLRRCADGTMRDSDKDKCAKDMLGTHPPAWLREERLRKAIEDTLAHLPQSMHNTSAVQKADEVIFSLDLFADETSTQILERLNQLNGN